MAEADKAPGWTYEHSAALSMGYAYRDTPDGLEVMVADKVRYSPREVALLQQAGGIKPGVHTVKKVFAGRIVGFSPGEAGKDRAKSTEMDGEKD